MFSELKIESLIKWKINKYNYLMGNDPNTAPLQFSAAMALSAYKINTKSLELITIHRRRARIIVHYNQPTG